MNEAVCDLFNKSGHYWNNQDPVQSLKCLNNVIDILNNEPDYAMYILAQSYRGLCYLSMGYLKEGFELYEFRNNGLIINDPSRKCLSEKVWQGQNIKGKKLLVFGEQGRGDTIQFTRYIPLLEAMGADVTLLTFPELVPLFKSAFNIQVMSIKTNPNKIAHDYWIKILSVPRILETVPLESPYLWADCFKSLRWQKYFNHTKINIGIVWAANSANKISADERTMDIKLLKPISELNNVCLYNLQMWIPVGNGIEQAGFTMIDLMNEVKDFSDTAAIIENLDLVISVDTAVAHLSGAMGKNVWTLLPYAGDWRWMWSDDKTLWYPSMKLFRQNSPNNWDSVVKHVCQELHSTLNNGLAEERGWHYKKSPINPENGKITGYCMEWEI